MSDALTPGQAAAMFVADLQHLGAVFRTFVDGDRRSVGPWSAPRSSMGLAREILDAVGRGSRDLQDAFVEAMFEAWPPLRRLP